MKKSEVFPSKYLAQADIPSPVVVTIKLVQMETLGQGKDQEDKPIIHFQGSWKPMVLNAGNWDCLEHAYGDESDLWAGRVCEIYVDPNVSFGGKRTGGLRLRIPSGGSKQSAGPSLMNIQMALTALQGCGLTKDDLKRCIEAKNPGATGFVAIRDTPAVLAMIEEARQNQGNKEESFDDGPSPDTEIPVAFWIGLIASGLTMAATMV
jgi:hypothetical protein